MTYCAKCGIYYTGQDDNCPGCGCSGSQIHQPERRSEDINNSNDEFPTPENKKETAAKTPDRDPIGIESEKQNGGDSQPESRYFQNESQLGKGIIKPQKVELAVDGVHFKYETPAHSFIKEEPAKPMVHQGYREYRVTDSDMEPKTPDEIPPEKELLTEEILPPVMEKETEAVEMGPMYQMENPSVEMIGEEKGEPPFDAAEISADQNLGIPEEPIAVELISEPVLPEPEMNDNEAATGSTVWEGAQTWLRIPIGNLYRVTGHSLIIFDKNRFKLFDVGLSHITGLSVKQSWLTKLLGIGDLLISIPEFAAPPVVLGGIRQPHKVKDIMEQLIPK